MSFDLPIEKQERRRKAINGKKLQRQYSSNEAGSRRDAERKAGELIATRLDCPSTRVRARLACLGPVVRLGDDGVSEIFERKVSSGFVWVTNAHLSSRRLSFGRFGGGDSERVRGWLDSTTCTSFSEACFLLLDILYLSWPVLSLRVADRSRGDRTLLVSGGREDGGGRSVRPVSCCLTNPSRRQPRTKRRTHTLSLSCLSTTKRRRDRG